MKISISKPLFGRLLEADIVDTISQTNLSKFTLHNIVLSVDNVWMQIDHLIILPHRLIIIEAKNSTAKHFEVYEDSDMLTFKNEPVYYSTSVVTQCMRALNFLQGSIFKRQGLNPRIDGVVCIRTGSVTNKQTKLQVYSDTDLWYFIRSLELEISIYDKYLLYSNFDKVLSQIKPYFKSHKEFMTYLSSNGSNTNRKMTVDDSFLYSTFTKRDLDNKFQNVRVERDKRVFYLLQTLVKKGYTLNEGMLEYCLDHDKMDVKSLVVGYMERFKPDNE